MVKNINIKDFVTETIKEIKEGLPEGFSISENIQFELSVITKEETQGKIGITVVSIDANTQIENLQKLKFAISDDKAQLKKMQDTKDMLSGFFENIITLDSALNDSPSELLAVAEKTSKYQKK